jgi:rod shape determining protein RodA
VEFALARLQIIYAVIGLVGAIILTIFDYRSWDSLAYVIYALGIGLLVAIFFFGSNQFGASRWIDLGVFQLQPSEIFKMILIIILAKFLSRWSGNFTLPRLLVVLVAAAIPTLLVFVQPDLGTASVLFTITLGMLVFARLPWRWWVAFAALAAIMMPVGYLHLKPYQKERIHVFLHPEDDPLKKGYNVKQAKIAIGSGGLMGQGLGKGSQSQLNFLPVAHTDFIFSGLAEATGLLGSSILIGLYFVLVARIFKIAELARDSFGMFLAIGVAIMVGFQIFVNIGMNLGLLPVTGIPLPLVSSGGTALIMTMAALGILQSIYIRHKKITF